MNINNQQSINNHSQITTIGIINHQQVTMAINNQSTNHSEDNSNNNQQSITFNSKEQQITTDR